MATHNTWHKDLAETSLTFAGVRTLSVLCSVGVLLLAKWITELFVFSPLRAIPGPLAARLTRIRAIYVRLPSRVMPAALADFHAYGDIYVSKPGAVTISNPRDVRTVLSSSAFHKIDVYHGLNDPVMANIVTFSDPAVASKRRRQIGPYFNSSYLTRMEPLILRNGVQAIKAKWDRLLDQQGQPVEVNYRHDIQLATFGIMSALAFGREAHSLATATPKVAIVEWITATAIYVGARINFSLLMVFPFSLLIRPWLRAYGDFVQWGKESVASRKTLLVSESQKPLDLLQAFIDAEDPESKVKMTAVEVQAESVGMQLAGSETTAASLNWALHLLTLYPEYRCRAVDEVRGQFDVDHLVTYSECQRLPFLEAFLHEMLRYTPITSSFMPRISATKGVTLQGHYIPPGTEIAFNLIALNNREDVWGNPKRFLPDRFLNTPELMRSIFAFSHGTRSCIGRNLAWMEMMTILANILKDYDLSEPRDSIYGPHNVDEEGIPRQMPSKCHIVFAPAYPERDCRLEIRKRSG